MPTQSRNWRSSLPQWLTLSRIVLTPAILACLALDTATAGRWAAGLFLLGSVTDWLDGYFARKFNAVSKFGQFMDPVADKIMVNSTLIMAIASNRVSAIVVVLVIARDVLISGLRSAAAVEQIVISAGRAGKLKTVLQMAGIFAVLLREPVLGVPLEPLGGALLWLSVALSIYSAGEYVIAYAHQS